MQAVSSPDKTIAKPISSRLKAQATQHERFRSFCVDLAQILHRADVKLRTNILGEPAKHIRPLSETKAIENGANALAEGFLFSVAASIIIGESWRTSRAQSRTRAGVEDRIDTLGTQLEELKSKMQLVNEGWEERWREEKTRSDELSRILERVVEIGLRGGWAEFEGTPLPLPVVRLTPHLSRENSSPSESVHADAGLVPNAPSSDSSLQSTTSPDSPPHSTGDQKPALDHDRQLPNF